MKRNVQIKRSGKRTNAWAACRRKLKPAFERAGVTSCELNYDKCWINYALGFAHSRKRRNLKPYELTICILTCNSCHDKLEIMSEPEMERIVLETIAKRENQVRI